MKIDWYTFLTIEQPEYALSTERKTTVKKRISCTSYAYFIFMGSESRLISIFIFSKVCVWIRDQNSFLPLFQSGKQMPATSLLFDGPC